MSAAPSQATRALVSRTVSGGWIIARALSLVIWRRNMAGSSQSPPDQRLIFVRLNARYCGFMTQAHSMQNAIEIDALSKTYEGGKQALDNVTVNVPRGPHFGLTGPNGTGTSPVIHHLSGKVKQKSGR